MTTSTCQTLLGEHKALSMRKQNSETKLSAIHFLIDGEKSGPESVLDIEGLSLFGAGSIGRREVGTKSDLDIFIISENKINDLQKYKLFSKLIEINRALGFPEFSNDGQFLKIHSLDDMIKAIGAPSDDSENFFTTRMLLILEGAPLSNSHIHTFDIHLDKIVANYFRDEPDHSNDFKPLFLLNDLLRFWRTLCLNYEQIRTRTDRPWRKKNINLKFSRMLTVFATVLPLIVQKMDKQEFIQLCKLTPLERLSRALDELKASDLHEQFGQFLDDYELFLSLKEREDIEHAIKHDIQLKTQLDLASTRFSQFLLNCVSHPLIPVSYRKYLVI